MDTSSRSLRLTTLEANQQQSAVYANLVNAPIVAKSPDETLHAYYNARALPRAYVASQCLTNITNEASINFLRDSDTVLSGQVTLAQNASSVNLNCASYSAKFERVPILSDRGSTLELQKVTGPALIVVNNYHYPGWKATVAITGEELPILTANAIFRGVYLPDERAYQIQMHYQPWWLRLVYGLFVAALILIAGVIVILGRTQAKYTNA